MVVWLCDDQLVHLQPWCHYDHTHINHTFSFIIHKFQHVFFFSHLAHTLCLLHASLLLVLLFYVTLWFLKMFFNCFSIKIDYQLFKFILDIYRLWKLHFQNHAITFLSVCMLTLVFIDFQFSYTWIKVITPKWWSNSRLAWASSWSLRVREVWINSWKLYRALAKPYIPSFQNNPLQPWVFLPLTY